MVHEGRLALSFETNPTNQALVDSFETAIRLRKAFPNPYSGPHFSDNHLRW